MVHKRWECDGVVGGHVLVHWRWECDGALEVGM